MILVETPTDRIRASLGDLVDGTITEADGDSSIVRSKRLVDRRFDVRYMDPERAESGCDRHHAENEECESTRWSRCRCVVSIDWMTVP